VIEFDNVTKVFPLARGSALAAVDRLSLTVRDGETLCLIGPSGCGKTTAMKLVNRLIAPTRGRIRIGGADVTGLDLIGLRRRIGYVIQTGGLFPHMTVTRNVGLLGEVEGWRGRDIEQRARELLELVNLSPDEFGARYPRDLSGGQRQRVGVARALFLDPPYVLMDEPFGALDPISRSQVQQEFAQLKARVRKTIIFVTHDMAEAFQLGDRIGLMERGRMVQVGTEQEFRESPSNPFVESFLARYRGPEAGCA
jgi:osmoprotectant transport system ATP-binding protein